MPAARSAPPGALAPAAAARGRRCRTRRWIARAAWSSRRSRARRPAPLARELARALVPLRERAHERGLGQQRVGVGVAAGRAELRERAKVGVREHAVGALGALGAAVGGGGRVRAAAAAARLEQRAPARVLLVAAAQQREPPLEHARDEHAAARAPA